MCRGLFCMKQKPISSSGQHPWQVTHRRTHTQTKPSQSHTTTHTLFLLDAALRSWGAGPKDAARCIHDRVLGALILLATVWEDKRTGRARVRVQASNLEASPATILTGFDPDRPNTYLMGGTSPQMESPAEGRSRWPELLEFKNPIFVTL